MDDLKLRHTFTGHTKEVLSAKIMDDSNKIVSELGAMGITYELKKGGSEIYVATNLSLIHI